MLKRHAQAAEGETHRNNLVIEAQGADRNAETKRSNLATLKESKRHNKASEKQAKADTKVKAATSVQTSLIGADAGRIAAQIKANASQYATDVKAASDAAKRANDALIASRNNTTAVKIQRSKNETSKALKKIDQLMQDKSLTQAERESLRKMYTEIKKSNDKLSADATQKELDRQAKLLTSATGILAMIGQSTTKAGKKTQSTASAQHIKQMIRGGTTEYKPGVYRETTGASPASTGSKSSSKHTSKRNVTIKAKKVTAKDKQKQQKSAAKKATFTRNPLSKVRQYTQTSKGKTKYSK